MNHNSQRSFVYRLGVCMLLSLALNILSGYYIKSSLSEAHYTLSVNAYYEADSTMEVYYETGSNFNEQEKVTAEINKGAQTVKFSFQLEKERLLRKIRLDFGSDDQLRKVILKSVKLSSGDRTIFFIDREDLSRKIGFSKGIRVTDEIPATFTLEKNDDSYDPYIVFNPINELILAKWQRTLILVLPWIILFFLPLMHWLRKMWMDASYELILVGIFLASIPLKIAWVTFATLLLLVYALYNYYRKRRIVFGPRQIAMLLLFSTPLVFLGKGELSKLAIPLGFVMFAIISAFIDFSGLADRIKKIYVSVYIVIMSITIIGWISLMLYDGYFYDIGIYNYFMEIKTTSHATLFWLYYPHTTYLSFFILIGGIFCWELYNTNQISKTYSLMYGLFAICTLLLLGSRFALFIGLLLPLLSKLLFKTLRRWLIPAWLSIFALIVYFIGALDTLRSQLWKTSWDAFKENIWFGHGTGSSDGILPDTLIFSRTGMDTLLEVNHPHNQFLTYLVENGILGGLLFLLALVVLLHHFIKTRNKTMLLISFMILLLMITETPFKTTTSLYAISFLLTVISVTNKRA